MPLELANISVAASLEKYKLASGERWVALVDITWPDDSHQRLARNVDDVTFDAQDGAGPQTYTAFNWEFEALEEKSDGSIPKWAVRCSNVNRAVEALLEEFSGGVGGKVAIYIVNTAKLQQEPETALFFDILSSSSDAQWVTFSLGAPSPFRFLHPRHVYTSNRCMWIYKSKECGYGAPVTTLGSITNGSVDFTVDQADGISVGDAVAGAGVPAGTTVATFSTTPTGAGNPSSVVNAVDYATKITMNSTQWELSGAQLRTKGGVIAGQVLDFVVAHNFDFSMIPAGAAIEGVVATLNWVGQNAGTGILSKAALYYQGNIFGAPKYPNVSNTASPADVPLGNPTDPWGGSLTDVIVKDATFGLGVQVTARDVGGTDRSFLDSITLTVYYSDPGRYAGTLSQAATADGTGIPLTFTKTTLMPSCSLRIDGANGCRAHGNQERFGAFPGIDSNGIRIVSVR